MSRCWPLTAAGTQPRQLARSEPEQSTLYVAVNGGGMIGSCKVPKMPQGMGTFAQADIDRIKAWIMAGAKND